MRSFVRGLEWGIDFWFRSQFWCNIYCPVQTRMVKICTRFQTKTAQKPYPLGLRIHVPIDWVHIREYYFPPTPRAHRLLHETGHPSSRSFPFLVARRFRSRLKESREKCPKFWVSQNPTQKLVIIVSKGKRLNTWFFILAYVPSVNK